MICSTERPVAPRRPGGKDLKAMPLEQFIELLQKEAAWQLLPTA